MGRFRTTNHLHRNNAGGPPYPLQNLAGPKGNLRISRARPPSPHHQNHFARSIPYRLHRTFLDCTSNILSFSTSSAMYLQHHFTIWFFTGAIPSTFLFKFGTSSLVVSITASASVYSTANGVTLTESPHSIVSDSALSFKRSKDIMI